ncbi:SRPBCC domain-containing protein [Arthrobacter sp. fls2-241-R2A-200]|uniref:SRPBCC domain-containing protein n=1 Tax=unclassified Arthrobacter TaxID=235627 RepID=UPI00254F1056|nr:SRPBCC domain-containing protein [Arthrobacter sp. fls2-241-R2A-200]
MNGHAADAVVSVTIGARREEVWQALTDPAIIRQYFLGTTVTSTWRVGEPITYSGEYNGTSYRDKGTILVFEPPELLKTTHFSPSTGLADVPENYHTVEYRLAESADGTVITITQGNNTTDKEVEQSSGTWRLVLQNLKELLESGQS